MYVLPTRSGRRGQHVAAAECRAYEGLRKMPWVCRQFCTVPSDLMCRMRMSTQGFGRGRRGLLGCQRGCANAQGLHSGGPAPAAVRVGARRPSLQSRGRDFFVYEGIEASGFSSGIVSNIVSSQKARLLPAITDFCVRFLVPCVPSREGFLAESGAVGHNASRLCLYFP